MAVAESVIAGSWKSRALQRVVELLGEVFSCDWTEIRIVCLGTSSLETVTTIGWPTRKGSDTLLHAIRINDRSAEE
jgi:hypothetical protein